jgi:hypothetical protein
LIGQEIRAERNKGGEPFHEWARKLMLDGRAFTFERHEYLIEPYQDAHPHQVEMKAAQMGLTTKAMLSALYLCRFGGIRGVLYLFPSRTDVLDFSKSRVAPLIDENPETIGGWIRDTDSAGLKQVGDAFLYLRGMQSRVGLKSVPVDYIVMDELDEAPQNAVDMALERMSHSVMKRVLKLSNPTLPDYGIDREFAESDQRYWLLRCHKCGGYTCVEDTFPDCLVDHKGKVYRVCQHCRNSVLNPSIGEWVAKRPSITEKRGYHYSQLFSHFVDPAEILTKFRTTTNLADFYNLKIGVAYVEAENRLSVQEVLDLCGSDGMGTYDEGLCSMGVDQGKALHVVIGKPNKADRDQILHIGVYKDWEELDRLMLVFRVTRCVVDALPETRNARAFAMRHRGKVYLNYYNTHQKGSYAWNDKEMIVTCNRTESLDASHKDITSQMVVLPRECDVVREFAHHMHNVAKKLEEDEETGSKRYVYVRLGPDHFRHAFNYECMARQNMPRWLFPEAQ